jgi:urease accessory protein
MSASLVAMLLADGRLPAGSHAHSGGIESAVLDGRVTGEASLERFVRARLATVGLGEAAMAAAAFVRLARVNDETALASALIELDDEADARLVAPPLRDASRRLGRQLLRVAERCWPDPMFLTMRHTITLGLHQPVAMGAVGVVAGITAADVARLAVHHAASMPAQAAVRLLGLDPIGAAAVVARVGPACEDVVAAALAFAPGPLSELPARSSPLLDIAAVEHHALDTRLFAT